MVSDLPETATFAEFAKILRCTRSYVTKLRKLDRLVLEGRRVRVAESIERIDTTRDPSKRGVAARHAAARGAAIATGHEANPEADATSEDDTRATSGYQHWKERSERAKALQAERENAREEGKLLDASQIAGAAESAAAVFRSATENLVLELAPELSDITDENRISALLSQRFGDMLEQLGIALGRMARGGD